MRNLELVNLAKPKNVLIWAWIIFAAALGLRVWGLGDYPPRHATDDEFHYMWAGLNFFDHDVPESWSGLEGANRIGVAQMDRNGYVIVSPALDHPPLFTLLAGGFAKLTNPHRIVQKSPLGPFLVIWDIDLHRARWMMMPIFAASFWLLFFVARRAFGAGPALLTVLIYGFMSHAAVHGRLILADNLSAVWLLLAAWAVMAWLERDLSLKAMRLIVAATTAAALLTKVPALCQVPVLIAIFIVLKRYREIWVVAAGFVVGALIYLGWVSYFGLEGFIRVMTAQAVRFRGFNAFQLISGAPRLLDIVDLNGVLIAGWFCALSQVLRPRVHPLMLIIPVYLLTFTFFAGDVIFGWYSVPMYPWLALAIAVTTVQVYRRPHMGMALGWLLLFLPWCLQGVYIAHLDYRDGLRYAYVAAVALLLFSFALPWRQTRAVLRIAMVIILSLVLMRETLEVAYQRQDRPTDQDRYF